MTTESAALLCPNVQSLGEKKSPRYYLEAQLGTMKKRKGVLCVVSITFAEIQS